MQDLIKRLTDTKQISDVALCCEAANAICYLMYRLDEKERLLKEEENSNDLLRSWCEGVEADNDTLRDEISRIRGH